MGCCQGSASVPVESPSKDRLPPGNSIRICTSCPSNYYNHVEALCSELNIRTAFGRKGDFMEDTQGGAWFGKWQNRVLQALDDALKTTTKQEGTISIDSLMINDDDNPHCKMEQDNMEHLANALKFDRASLSFDIRRRLVYVQDLTKEVCTLPRKEHHVQRACKQFLESGKHKDAWSFYLMTMALKAQNASPGPSMQILIQRGDVVGSILTGEGAHQPKDCDIRFCERVAWLLRCADASRRIRPIVEKRWKIPIRFDPQSRLAQWAVEAQTNLDSERDFARCIQDVVLSKGNHQAELRMQLFKRWHCVSDIQEASQKEEELKWILQEAREADLPGDVRKDIEEKLRECREELQKDVWYFVEMLHLTPKVRSASHRKHEVDPENEGKCFCYKLYGQRVAWGCSWHKRYLEYVREAVAAIQKGDEGEQHHRVDDEHGLKQDFPEGYPVDAWCEVTKSWRRGVVKEKKTRQEGGSANVEALWTIRCEHSEGTFHSSFLCDTAAATKELLDHFGHLKLREIFIERLKRTSVLDIRAARLGSGLSSLMIKLGMPTIGSLHYLRDRFFSGDLEEEINRGLSDRSWRVEMDSASFLEFYEHTLLAFKDLTPHQRKHLQDIRRFDEVHLSAPAGAGKTFVAVQRVVDVLTDKMEEPPAHVLYVAPTVELAYYFIQWMIVRLASQAESRLVSKINELLQRTVVLHGPYQALLSPRLDEKDRRITLEVAGSIDTFGLAVIDESHTFFAEGVDQGILADLKSRRRLLLSDESQAATVGTRFPQMHRANLTEVVRSTRQIVLGARAFRSDTGAVTSSGTDGPPLKSFLFEGSDARSEFELYAKHVADAIAHVADAYPNISLHQRLALLVPDEEFLAQLKTALPSVLKSKLPDRHLHFVSFKESLRSLPELFRTLGSQPVQKPQQQLEHIVLDTVSVTDGLEKLIVMCIGLDAPIRRGAGDLVTRANLYKGITRAQLKAIVVNKRVPEGWFDFLTNIRYSGKELSEEEASKYGSQAAAKICQEAKDGIGSAAQEEEPSTHNSRSREEARPQPSVPDERQADLKKESSHVERSQQETTATSRKADPDMSQPQTHSTSTAERESELTGDSETTPQHESSIWDTRSNTVSAHARKPIFDPFAEESRVPVNSEEFLLDPMPQDQPREPFDEEAESWQKVKEALRADRFDAASALAALKNFAAPALPYPDEARAFVVQESKRVMRCGGDVKEAARAAGRGELEELLILVLFGVGEELDMEDCWKVPAEAWRQLRDARWEKLRKANFTACFDNRSQGAEGAGGLLAALARCSELQELDMGYCFKVPAEAWRQLRDARWEKLQRAIFSSCFGRGSQGAEGAGGLLAALARCSQLQELDMPFCFKFPAEAWRQLGDARWEKLKRANFYRCFGEVFGEESLGAEGAGGLLSGLARCSQLQELNMDSCYKVPAEAWRQLRDARWEKLRKADFTACFDERSEGAEGTDILLAALARCSELQELNMHHCYEVPAEAWRQLRDARWEKLQSANFALCFGEDSQGVEGADILLAALARCSELQELDMRFCFKVPAEAWRQLGDARWEELKKADFDQCFGEFSQGAEGADVLLTALARCSALQELYMANCERIPAEAWEQLSDGVWPALREYTSVPKRLFRR